jgi:hypothetical protein
MKFDFVYWGIVASVILLLLLLAEYPVVGQVVIGAYALLAFWKFESSQVFKLAMVMLAVMLGAMVMGMYQVVDAFSAYAFLLFMVGVFVLVRELWHFSKDLRRKREEDNA